jgi:hypothetical protein
VADVAPSVMKITICAMLVAIADALQVLAMKVMRSAR